MKLDVAFVPTDEHVEILEEHQDHIHSVYFAPNSSIGSNARISHEAYPTQLFVQQLQRVNARKYVTLNGRFTPIEMYKGERLERLAAWLRTLYEAGQIDGIIYLDFFMLRALSGVMGSELEAVPSINCGIDTAEKFFSHARYIDDIGFTLPDKVILDRALNRRPEDLHRTVEAIRKSYDVRIELLANEGCLYQCPYKVNHDIVVSMFNDHTKLGAIAMHQAQGADFNIRRVNEDLGCIAHLEKHFDEFFKAPFIRPEDLHHYEGVCDILKISGKINGPAFNSRAIKAYLARAYDGNLIDILDAPGQLSDKFFVLNDELNRGFHQKLTTCDKDCLRCNYCAELTERIVQKTGVDYAARQPA